MFLGYRDTCLGRAAQQRQHFPPPAAAIAAAAVRTAMIQHRAGHHQLCNAAHALHISTPSSCSILLQQRSRIAANAAAAAAAAAAATSDAAAAIGQDSTLSDLSLEEPTSFTELGVDPLLVAGLAESGIEVPSPIQEASIPVLLSGANAAIQSYTGSGKTLAYLLPALTLALKRAEAAYRRRQAAVSASRSSSGRVSIKEEDLWTVQALVVAPSQELAMQIARVAQGLFPKDSRTAVQQAIGGANLRRQAEAIAEHQPILVVGTPGRVVDLVGMGVLRLHRCPLLVLDEADQLLGDVYVRHINTLMQHCGKRLGSGSSSAASSSGSSDAASNEQPQQPPPPQQQQRQVDEMLQPSQRQTILVSATLWSGGLERFKSWCPKPQFVTMGASPTWSDDFTDGQGSAGAAEEPAKAWGWGAKGWEGPASVVQAGPKTQGSVGGPEGQGLVPTLPPQLEHMYIVVNPDRKSDVLRRAVHALNLNMGLGFMNWQQRLKDMAAKVAAKRIEVAALHGELQGGERGAIFEAARNGAYQLLLVSDLAARGLDMPNVDAVFNLELPSSAAHYAHRAGRTGRMGAPGLVITLVAPGERFVVERLSKKLGVPIMECHLSGGELVVGPPPKKDKKKRLQHQPEDEDAVAGGAAAAAAAAGAEEAQQQADRDSAPAGSSSKKQGKAQQAAPAAAAAAAAAAATAATGTAPKSKSKPSATDGITFDPEAAVFDPTDSTGDEVDESGVFLLDEADDVEVEGDEPLEVYRARVRKELEAELAEIQEERKQRRQAQKQQQEQQAQAADQQVEAGGGRRVRQRSKAGAPVPKGTPQEAALLAMAAIEADEASKKARARLPAELLGGSRGGRKLRGSSTRKPRSSSSSSGSNRPSR